MTHLGWPVPGKDTETRASRAGPTRISVVDQLGDGASGAGGRVSRMGPRGVGYVRRMPLPTLVVIGAMKSGTTALHRYLDLHPQIAMAEAKEVNFFNGPAQPPPRPTSTWWRHGQWHRGTQWYAGLFDDRAPVRGETSPGYTSPDHPEVPGRMATTLPDVRLLCLVRDPAERALSHYRHHRREGDEQRRVDQALLDPESHYLARGRYHALLQPYLDLFAPEQLLVLVSERLRRDRRDELRRVYAHVGADPDWWDEGLRRDWHVAESDTHHPDPGLAGEVRARLEDDTQRLRLLLDDDIPEWAA